jgi:DNA mismatch repair protein MutS
MMQQYLDAKRACPEAVLLFRMGDFYELFYEDAQTAARVLKLTLTSREKGENAIPMAGFPFHQLDGYLAKLIAAGLRVAVCDQVEDPKQAKGLVRREVTRIVSPGTVTDDALLDPRESNYLCAILPGEMVGAAWVELSTGRFLATRFPIARLADELARIAPSECLISEDIELSELSLPSDLVITRRPGWVFSWGAAQEALEKQFGRVAWEGFGFAPDDTVALRAAGAILDYLHETQKTSLGHLDRLLAYRAAETLEIDESTRRSLEITRTLREGKREGSLLATIDRTVTAMGSRSTRRLDRQPVDRSRGNRRAARCRGGIARGAFTPR